MFLAIVRGFETHKVCHINNQNTLHPSHPTDFFTTQILGDHVTSRNRVSLLHDKGGKGESASVSFTLFTSAL